jgi:hypothetical protein
VNVRFFASAAPLLWILSTGCSGAAEVPDTPDLTVLDHEYNSPSAVIDPTEIDQVLADLPELRRIASGFRATGYTTRGVDEAEDSSQEDETLRVQGSVRVTIRCPGELDDPVYDANANGSLSLTIGVENSHIRRGIGGRATNCVLRGDDDGLPVRVSVDGPFAFDLGRDLSIRDRWSGRLLMLISGTIHIGDLELKNLSARWKSDKFEYLFVLPNDDWIIAQLTQDGISIRDKERTWVCPDGQPCGF